MYANSCGDSNYSKCDCGWSKMKLLGRGAHGSVYLARVDKTGEEVAIKQVLIDGLNDNHLAGALANEIRMNQELQHPNIVRYLGTQKCGNCLNIILEYCDHGSLRQLLQSEGAFTEATTARYTQEILSGAAYLHENGFAHRDIKGANVLLSSDGSCKLADFGASKRLSNDSVISGLKGTPHWMAPEIIRGQQTPEGWKKADVWSIGCTVIEMLTGKMPWPMYTNPIAAMYHIANGECPPILGREVSSEASDFVKACCAGDPNLRPTAKELLNHPFLALADCRNQDIRDHVICSSASSPYIDSFPDSPNSCNTSTTADYCSDSCGSVHTKLPSPCSTNSEMDYVRRNNNNIDSLKYCFSEGGVTDNSCNEHPQIFTKDFCDDVMSVSDFGVEELSPHSLTASGCSSNMFSSSRQDMYFEHSMSPKSLGKITIPTLERASSWGCAAIRREAINQLESSCDSSLSFISPPTMCRNRSLSAGQFNNTPTRLPPLQRQNSFGADFPSPSRSVQSAPLLNGPQRSFQDHRNKKILQPLMTSLNTTSGISLAKKSRGRSRLHLEVSDFQS